MKATDKPEISSQWWKKNRPDDIEGKELERALVRAEEALAAADKKKDGDSINVARSALGGLGNAVGRTIKDECEKTRHKDVIKVLERYEDLLKAKTKSLVPQKSGKGDKERKFDHGKPRVYFTSDFLKHHVYVGSAPSKKRAEIVFQSRLNPKGKKEGKPKVTDSSVIWLTAPELVTLANEVFEMQDEYGRAPNATFTTAKKYEIWSRGDATDKQQATSENSTFSYGVRLASDIYVMSHFAGT
jgi:hypothetical protein